MIKHPEYRDIVADSKMYKIPEEKQWLNRFLDFPALKTFHYQKRRPSEHTELNNRDNYSNV
jgi:hypothetical protein